MKIKVLMAQINTRSGDLQGNTDKIISTINQAIGKADIVVFPETAITGYCVGGLYDDKQFVYDAVVKLSEIIKQVPKDLVVIVGNLRWLGMTHNDFPILKNSAFIIQGSEIIGISDKQLLANTGHHEDKKYFRKGDWTKKFEVTIKGKKVKIGVPICEDIWNMDHERDIVEELTDITYNSDFRDSKVPSVDLILVPNQSFFFYGKQNIRETMVYKHVAEKGVPMVYVNSVGVGDIVKNIMIFDGGSFSVDVDGTFNRCKSFSEELKVTEIHIKERNDELDNIEYEEISKDKKYEEIYNALIFVQKEMFSQLGLKAQVHLSGGIDSALVATIVAHSMDKKDVVFITNPTNFNSEKTLDLAQQLANNLKIKLYTNDIWVTSENLRVGQVAAFRKQPSKIAYGSGQAIIRTAAGIMATHHFNSGIVATGNHTEITLGWATFHDIGSIGVHALIGDLTKVEVFELSDWINDKFNKEIIPKELYDGTVKPDAELGDNDGDPFDYYVYSGICASIIRERMNPSLLIEKFESKDLIEEYFPNERELTSNISIYDRIGSDDFEKAVWDAYNRIRTSVYKAAQGAPIVIIAPRSRGFSNRETILNFYRRN